ncbi:MAG: protein kinase family protein [Actinomycetota bacterium]|nr:protein kinase family protein [Actinomycetota bacterium]
MTASSIGPGTVLGGRYRLDDLLTVHDEARFWRATDTVLARSVAVHAVPTADRRAAELAEAAQRSATVIDPHLLRVLDSDSGDGITWVINEWGDGLSLDLMLERGVLPASRAAWLTREVAEAVAAGHAVGVAHGLLAPERVLVTQAGAVKVIGFAVDAALAGSTPTDPAYGAVGELDADVINLAGILYAALVGRWPGVTPSEVPPAPREGQRPLRPRRVRAGVPRTLDAICERVLNKEASQHVLPLETAHEITAALSDYVGNPAAMAPADVRSMHSEPTVRAPITRAAPPDALGSGSENHEPATREGSVLPAASALSSTVGAGGVVGAAEVDPEATMAASPDLSPLSHEEPAPPPPPFDQPADRPLYAPGERQVPTPTEPRDATSPGSGYWPFAPDPAAPPPPIEEPPEDPPGQDRHWLRLAAVIGTVAILVAAALVWVSLNRHHGSSGGRANRPNTSSAGPRAAAAGTPLKIVAIHDFDPQGNPPQENPQTVPNAVDGNPSTYWQTNTYFGNPKLGGLKSGVGMLLDLGADKRVGSVVVTLVGSPTSLELYAAPARTSGAPTSTNGLRKVGSVAATGTSARFRVTPPVRTRYLVVWLTSLPPVAGGYRGEIAEIAVTS